MATTRSMQILAELTSEAAEPGGPSLPQRVVDACAAALPVTGVGLIVMTDKGPGAMLAATDGPRG